eukprot:g23478.t1
MGSTLLTISALAVVSSLQVEDVRSQTRLQPFQNLPVDHDILDPELQGSIANALKTIADDEKLVEVDRAVFMQDGMTITRSTMARTAPALTALQRRAAERSYPPVPPRCCVTGGSGFVGQRLVEMLVERGAERVVSFDILPQPPSAWQDLKQSQSMEDVSKAVNGADCVWHVGAAACLEAKVPKLVMSSSPSTRFDGSDIDGLLETELPSLPQMHDSKVPS